MSWGVRPSALPNIILGCWLVMSWAVSVAGEPARVGLLALGSLPLAAVEAVTRDLRALGYRHGENIGLEARYAEGKLERLPVLAKELVDLLVHVIVAVDTRALVASKQATRAIPIVSASGGGDFAAIGLIADWDRPGGDVTGVNVPALEAVHKLLELFTHAMPSLVRLAVLVHAPSPTPPQLWREVEVAAKARHVHVLPLYVSHSEDLEEAFQEAQHLGAQAVMTLYTPFFARHTAKIVALAAKPNYRWREANLGWRQPARCSRWVLTITAAPRRQRRSSPASSRVRRRAGCRSSVVAKWWWYSTARQPTSWGSPLTRRLRGGARVIE